MKMGKKIYFMLLAALCMAVLSGCGNPAGVYNNEEKLASDVDSYNIVSGVRNQLDNGAEGSFGKMEGMVTARNFEAEEDTAAEMEYDFTVAKGKAKLILVTPDGAVTTLVELEETDSGEAEKSGTIELRLKKGKNMIRAVGGKEASFSYTFTVEKAEEAAFDTEE